MATLLNAAFCNTSGNTGVVGCNNEPGFIRYACFVPKGSNISSSNLASQTAFNTYVDGKLIADSRSGRWFLSPELMAEDKTEATKFADKQGFKILSQKMPYTISFELLPGNKCIHQKLYTLLDQMQDIFDVYLIDDNGLWMGVDDGSGGLNPYTIAQLTVDNWMIKKSGDVNKYTFQIQFADYREMNQNYASFLSTKLTSKRKGLTDVTLSQGATTLTTSAIYVTGLIACGGSDLGDVYGSIINSATAWKVYNAAGSAVSLTGCTYNSTTHEFAIASSSAFTSGATFTVALSAPSVLTGLGTPAYIVTETRISVTIP